VGGRAKAAGTAPAGLGRNAAVSLMAFGLVRVFFGPVVLAAGLKLLEAGMVDGEAPPARLSKLIRSELRARSSAWRRGR